MDLNYLFLEPINFLSQFIYFWNLFKLSLNLYQILEPIEIIGTYFDSLISPTLLED